MKTLVTKLMSSVNNADSPYFNVVEIIVDQTRYTYTSIIKPFNHNFILAADKGTITADGDNIPAQEITVVKGAYIKITYSSEVKKLYIKNNFETIQGIRNFGELNGIYLNYIPNCWSLTGDYLFASIKELGENMKEILIFKGGLYGDVSELKSKNYTRFCVFNNAQNIVGTLNDLCEHLADESTTEIYIAKTQLTGDIFSISNKVSVSAEVSLNFNITAIYGTVESIINYLTGKKKSSTLTINANASQITYNGSSFNKVKFTFDADGNPTLTENTQ